MPDEITPTITESIDIPGQGAGTAAIQEQTTVVQPQVTVSALEPVEPQATPKPKHPGGRPCKFCENSEEYLRKAKEYLARATKGEKPRTPFIEELALELNTIDENIVNWANKLKEDGTREHEEFFTIYTTVKMVQKLRLKQRALGRFNPTGALAILRFDHGAVETSKQILGSGQNGDQPLEIRIVEAPNVTKD